VDWWYPKGFAVWAGPWTGKRGQALKIWTVGGIEGTL